MVDRLLTGQYIQDSTYHMERRQGTSTYLLMVTLAGAGYLRHGAAPVPLRRGDVWLYRPHEPQRYGTDTHQESWSFAWAHFIPKPHWMETLQWAGGVVRLDEATLNRVARPLILADEDLKSGRPGHRELAMNALERALLEITAQTGYPGIVDGRIQQCLAQIAKSLPDDHSVESLAASSGLSPSRFAAVFKANVGIPPLQYVDELRLEAARQRLLMTGDPIKQIAHEVGYRCPFYFSRRFRQQFGTSPRAYRTEPNQPRDIVEDEPGQNH